MQVGSHDLQCNFSIEEELPNSSYTDLSKILEFGLEFSLESFNHLKPGRSCWINLAVCFFAVGQSWLQVQTSMMMSAVWGV